MAPRAHAQGYTLAPALRAQDWPALFKETQTIFLLAVATTQLE
jgi:hypothetical protein